MPNQTATPTAPAYGKPLSGWRLRLYTIIFEADTKAGQRFDRWLILAITVSLIVVVADSVESISSHAGTFFSVMEWIFTLLFTAEYIARLICVRHPIRYATSFFGVIDLLALLPTYAAMLIPELHLLIDVRVLRLLRIFRVFKLTSYFVEIAMLGQALRASARKIAVFLMFVMMVVLIMGTVMYVIEGPVHGFTSIPTAMYWAITTMTTVGFGDITPKTDLGRLIASMMMLMGWGTLAVPTGIVTVEMATQKSPSHPTTRSCQSCLTEGHEAEAQFCKDCGAKLPPYARD